jgi:hypothetical protein
VGPPVAGLPAARGHRQAPRPEAPGLKPARIVKRELRKIQYRPHLTGGCLAGTGLAIEPW